MNEVKPPEGYRLLTEGETIKAGDLWLRPPIDDDNWNTAPHSGGRWNPREYWPMARKVENDSKNINR